MNQSMLLFEALWTQQGLMKSKPVWSAKHCSCIEKQKPVYKLQWDLLKTKPIWSVKIVPTLKLSLYSVYKLQWDSWNKAHMISKTYSCTKSLYTNFTMLNCEWDLLKTNPKWPVKHLSHSSLYTLHGTSWKQSSPNK